MNITNKTSIYSIVVPALNVDDPALWHHVRMRESTNLDERTMSINNAFTPTSLNCRHNSYHTWHKQRLFKLSDISIERVLGKNHWPKRKLDQTRPPIWWQTQVPTSGRGNRNADWNNQVYKRGELLLYSAPITQFTIYSSCPFIIY